MKKELNNCNKFTFSFNPFSQTLSINPQWTHLIIMYLERASTAEVCKRGHVNFEGLETTSTMRGSKRERRPVEATSISHTFRMRSESVSSAVAPVRPISSSREGELDDCGCEGGREGGREGRREGGRVDVTHKKGLQYLILPWSPSWCFPSPARSRWSSLSLLPLPLLSLRLSPSL